MTNFSATQRCVLLSLSFALISSTALAQDGAITLDQIQVTADQRTQAERTVEKAREEIQRTPGGVETVASKEYRDTAAVTLKDALDYVPGVFAQPKFGEDLRLSIRGSGLSRNFHLRGVKLMQDGIPINSADGGGDFQEVDPLAALYIDVYKGANALRFGSSFLGGAINLVSPTGRDLNEPIIARLEAGSYGFRRVFVGSGQQVGNWDYFISSNFTAQDGYRQQNTQDSRRITGNIGYRFSDSVETRFYYNLNAIKQEIPGAVTRFQALNFPKLANSVNLLNNYQRNITSFRFGSKTTVKIGDASELNFGGYAIYRELDHPIFQVVDNTTRGWGVFANGKTEGQIAGFKNVFVAGVNVNGELTAAKRFINIRGIAGTPTYVADESANNVEAYAENQFFFLNNVALVLGAQSTYAERNQAVKFGAPSGSKDFLGFNPKVGVLWQIDPTWQAFANLSRSFEPPPISELSTTFVPVNPADIKAQTSWTGEIGTRGRRDDYRWDLSVYRAEIKNELQFIDLGGGASRVQNADKTIHQGAEIGGGISILKGLLASGEKPDRIWLNAAYTYSDFRFDGDRLYGNNQLPGAPRHYIRAELVYENPKGFSFGPSLEWVPQSYFVDNVNTASLKAKSYALLGFKAGYELPNGVSFFLDARNLTDEKYISNVSVTGTAVASSALFVPGNGRSVYAGLRYKW